MVAMYTHPEAPRPDAQTPSGAVFAQRSAACSTPSQARPS